MTNKTNLKGNILLNFLMRSKCKYFKRNNLMHTEA